MSEGRLSRKTAIELSLRDALRLLDEALDHGRVLHRTGCDCRDTGREGTHECFSCQVRERIAFGRAALERTDE